MKIKVQFVFLFIFFFVPLLIYCQINLEWNEIIYKGLPSDIRIYKTNSQVNGHNVRAWYAIADIDSENIEFRTENIEQKNNTLNTYGFQGDLYVCINGQLIQDNEISKTNAKVRVNSHLSKVFDNIDVTEPNHLLDLIYYAPIIKNHIIVDKDASFTRGVEVRSNAALQEAIIDDNSRCNRTCIGKTSDNKLVLFICDGLQNEWSEGLTQKEVASIMKQLGCVDASDLTSSRGSSMIADGNLINRPVYLDEPEISSVLVLANKTKVIDRSDYWFTQVWTRCSADNNKPKWFGTDTERGIAYANGHLYVASRANGTNSIKILDAETGDDISHLILTDVVTGGSFAINDVETSDDNQILVGNMTVDASSSPFRIYRWKNETSTPELYLSLNGEGRIGDNFTVKGDLSKDAVIYAPVARTNIVYRWRVKDGLLTNPEKIEIQGIERMGACGSVSAYGIKETDHFLLNGNELTPLECSGSGESIGRINPSLIASLSGGMEYFEFNNRCFLLCSQFSASLGNKDSQSSVLIDLTNCSPLQVSEDNIYGFTPILGKIKNGNSAGDVCVKTENNDLILYTLGTNNGISAYRPERLLSTSSKSILDDSLIKISPNPANEYIQLIHTKTPSLIRIFDMQGHMMLQKIIKNGSDKVNISFLKKNLYLVEIISDERSYANMMMLGN